MGIVLKCEVCGKEVVLPFQCAYCSKYFCKEHRLPESHKCFGIATYPKWQTRYHFHEAKEKIKEQKEEIKKPSQKFAPVQPKRKTRIRIPTRRIKNVLSTYFVGAVLALVGLGIIYWQIYSPALTFLLLFFVIPIPLILIGIVLFVIGFLAIIGTIVSMIRKPSISIKLVAIPLVFSLVIFSSFGILVFSTMHRTFYVGTNLVDTDYIQAQVFDLINEERLSRGLPKLSFDQKLADVAQIWSEDLAKRKYLEHGNFEARMSAIGYGSYQCGEIIEEIPLGGIGFFQTPLEREFVDGWLKSAGHQAIMLMPLTGYLGVGCSKNSGSIYCVADFRFD